MARDGDGDEGAAIAGSGVRLRLDQVPWTRVAELDLARTAVFLLSGPLEQHGPHLPLGTDLFQAAYVRDAVARRVLRAGWNVLLAPPLPYTTAVLSRSYPGSVSIHRAHAADFFCDLLTSFAAQGLIHQVVVSQHLDPPHVLAWEDACERAAEAGARAIEGYERMVFDDLRSGALADLLGPGHAGDSHAGVFETSVMLAARPALVDVPRAASLEPMPMDFERDLRGARDFRDLGNGLGYTGAPGAASAQVGRRLAARYARAFGDAVCDHLAGKDVRASLSVRSLFPER
jgi:creatinine amidohydrolase